MSLKATLPGAAFAQAVQRCAAMVPGRVTIPIIGNLLLRGDGDRMDIAGTNMDQALTIGVGAEAEGATTAPAATLEAIAARIDGAQPVQLTASETQLTIRQGRTAWRLPILPREDFPEALTEAIEGRTWELPAPTLAAHLKGIEGAINASHHNPALQGIYFDLERETPALVATDTFRFGQALIDDLTPPKVAGFVLPYQAVKPLVETGEAGGPLTLTAAPNAVTVDAGTARVWTRLLAGNYPPYQKIIPDDRPLRVHVDPAKLAATLNRVVAIEGDEIKMGKGKVTVHAVRLQIGADEILATTANAQGAGVEDVCPCKRIAGGDAAVTANGAYLAWAAGSLPQGGDLELGFGDPGTAITVTRADDPDRRSLRLITSMRG